MRLRTLAIASCLALTGPAAAEWRADVIPTPGPVSAIEVDGTEVRVAVGSYRYRISADAGSLVRAEPPDRPAVPADALSAGRVALADFVFMANAFHGVPDRPRLVRAVRAILKPGGHFAIVNWHQRPREETVILGEPRGPKTELRLSPEQTTEAVAKSGLRLVVEIPPYHYGAIFERPASEP